MISLGLSLWSTTILARGGVDIYSVGGFSPSLVFDFEQEFYRTSGTTSTFSDSITHARSGNAVMVDESGLLKWAPHNLLTYSEQFDNAAWVKSNVTVTASAATAPDGTATADKVVNTGASGGKLLYQTASTAAGGVVAVYAKAAELSRLRINELASNAFSANFNLSAETATLTSGANGISAAIEDIGSGWYRCSLSHNATGSRTYTVVGYPAANETTAGNPNYDASAATDGIFIWGAHLYRSDLGGMVNNPDTGNSYVPTTTAARYLPRRGHHVYNGSEWVNEGLLVESEARTNLLTYSNFDNDASWLGIGIVGTAASGVTSPDGTTSNVELLTSSGGSNARYYESVVLTGENYTWSGFFKAATHDIIALTLSISADFTDRYVWFDLTAGTKGTVGADILGSGIEDYGNGWYRCWIMNAGTVDTYFPRVHILDSDGVTTSTSGDSVYAYGAQLEAGSTPSSLIPTSGATVTRPADTLTVPSANLPWPSPVVIGEELVTNGTFDADTSGWSRGFNSVDGTFTATGGVATYIVGAGDGASPRMISTAMTGLTIGQTYLLKFSEVSATGTGDRVVVWTSLSNGVGGQTISQVIPVGWDGEDKTFIVIATATTMYVAVGFASTSAGSTISFDNISVREINPLAVSIQMDGTATGDSYTPTRWYLNASNAILQDIGTTNFTFTQEAAGVVDTVTGGSFTSGVNTPFNIASRHGSTFINGSVDGTALTADTTPTALPDLSATNLQLAFDYMGTIRTFRVWADDLGDENIEIASATAPVIIGLPTIGVS
jgi:hypothetical protein